ncbi:HD-GYP domain-containing protein [Phycisphaerales bacterium AB-hyl4]|uniref:HD-GYP domain-containing protein n=1 Tax=Natronomicrosphaera hydrolytica TaxID=3242702 RepID=A0ABV4U293_9BACT
MSLIVCDINDVEPGVTLAGAVFHPARPNRELLEPGVELDARLLRRLKQLGVRELWVHHEALADLDRLIPPTLGQARRAACEQLYQDFKQMADITVTSGHVQIYRRAVMDMVCELAGNRAVGGLSERLIGGPPGLFTHATNVAYLSVLVGLELETYVVGQRQRLTADHARDLTSLGIGALLHDMGKLTLPKQMHHWQVLSADDHAAAALADGSADEWLDDLPDDPRDAYRSHTLAGYHLLRGSRAPAPATQIVLNHHQRWDGSGFPDMSDATESRREGTQQGEAIHIFSRIVAAADVLDHLMHDASGKTRPAVSALSALASRQFEGWFDPVVRDTLLRCIPPFVIGSQVTLSDGRAAAVVRPSVEQPCRPAVRLLGEADREADGCYPTLDLRETPDVHIATCSGHDVAQHLFALEERRPLRRIAEAV